MCLDLTLCPLIFMLFTEPSQANLDDHYRPWSQKPGRSAPDAGQTAVWTDRPSCCPDSCHWLELPEVLFLSGQTFCLNKTRFLSRQKYAYRDKMLVATKTILVAGAAGFIKTIGSRLHQDDRQQASSRR